MDKVEFIESYIKIGNGDYQWNDNHGELVRCKDCKWRWTEACFCKAEEVEDMWFCSEGERKEGR